jgi:hypothetical protein
MWSPFLGTRIAIGFCSFPTTTTNVYPTNVDVANVKHFCTSATTTYLTTATNTYITAANNNYITAATNTYITAAANIDLTAAANIDLTAATNADLTSNARPPKPRSRTNIRAIGTVSGCPNRIHPNRTPCRKQPFQSSM